MSELRRLLICHRTPWDQLAWLTGRTERLWRRAPYVHMRFECGGAPCPEGQCAHARRQISCALDLQLPLPAAYENVSRARAARSPPPLAMGCHNCECWEGEGLSRTSSGGKCNFTREYVPKLPEHCWERAGGGGGGGGRGGSVEGDGESGGDDRGGAESSGAERRGGGDATSTLSVSPSLKLEALKEAAELNAIIKSGTRMWVNGLKYTKD